MTLHGLAICSDGGIGLVTGCKQRVFTGRYLAPPHMYGRRWSSHRPRWIWRRS